MTKYTALLTILPCLLIGSTAYGQDANVDEIRRQTLVEARTRCNLISNDPGFCQYMIFPEKTEQSDADEPSLKMYEVREINDTQNDPDFGKNKFTK